MGSLILGIYNNYNNTNCMPDKLLSKHSLFYKYNKNNDDLNKYLFFDIFGKTMLTVCLEFISYYPFCAIYKMRYITSDTRLAYS